MPSQGEGVTSCCVLDGYRALLALEGGWDGAFYGFSSFYFAPFQPALRRCGAEVGVGYP